MKIFRLLIIAVFLIGCTDLEEEIYDKIPSEIYPEDEAQVSGISVGAYSYFQPLADDEGWWFLAQEVSSDEIIFPTRDTDWDDGGKWRAMDQHTWNNNTEGVNRMWAKFYEGVANCNKIIELLKSFPKSDAFDAKIAEVEAVRTFFYYLLIDNYGDVPYVTNFVGAPEKPYKDKRESVFDSLTTLLENILPKLKLIDAKSMATRYMAFGLLAKLYLNAEIYTGTAQWAKAEQYIDSVLAGPYSLSSGVSEPFVTTNDLNPEIIFSIPYDENTFTGFRLHMRTLHYQHNLTYDMPVGPWNGGCIMYSHFLTFEDNDLRKEWFIYGPQYDSKGKPIIENTTKLPLVINPNVPKLRMTSSNNQEEIKTTGARIGKYEIKKGAKENLSNDFPLFRLSDFYLMKAEVLIRQEGDGAGDEWVNPIRERAGLDLWSGSTLTDLLAERGRELFAEGHRRQDLIRFGKFTNIWWAKGDDQGGKAGDPSVTVFPIPKWATDANSNLLAEPLK